MELNSDVYVNLVPLCYGSSCVRYCSKQVGGRVREVEEKGSFSGWTGGSSERSEQGSVVWGPVSGRGCIEDRRGWGPLDNCVGHCDTNGHQQNRTLFFFTPLRAHVFFSSIETIPTKNKTKNEQKQNERTKKNERKTKKKTSGITKNKIEKEQEKMENRKKQKTNSEKNQPYLLSY